MSGSSASRPAGGPAPLAGSAPLLIAFLLALAPFLVSSPLPAQDNDLCLVCHEMEDLTGSRGGRPISVFVEAKTLAASVHDGLGCIDCHADLAGTETEHAEEVAPADCSPCHEEEAAAHARSLHGQAAARGDKLAPRCRDCHGGHDIRPAADPASPTNTINIPLLCGKCHHEGSPVSLTHDIPQDRILDNYSESIHGEGLFKKGLTVTAVCTSCHTAHDILPHTDPRSSIHRDNVARTCTRCHARIEEVHRKVIEGQLWEKEPHKIPSCVDCHSPHKIRRVFYPAGMANKDCLTCHARPELTMSRAGETISLFVDEEAYNASSHSGTACAQCHTEVTSSHVRPCETVRSPVDCSICHADQVREHTSGTHGRLAAQGDADAPTCLDCHSKHATLSHRLPISPTYPRNVPDLCARCHREGEAAAKRIDPRFSGIVHSYEESIHGKGLLQSGLVVTATCSSCHGAHAQLPPDDPASRVNPKNIATTCGQCHHGIEEEFRTSVHGQGEAKDGRKLPNCEDCHTSHTISRTDRDDFRLLMMSQCGRCHEAESETFFDTYHGKVSRLGDAGAAKCYDCHGTHSIQPIDDPRSTLSRRSIVATCAKCHAGAHRRFAGYLTHATHHDPRKYPFLFGTFWFMASLLGGTLTVATLHTSAWLWRIWRSRAEWRPHRAAPGEKHYRRFTTFQRTLHLFLLLSFFTLALTGMSLKFSYMSWAQRLSSILGGFETMGLLHRLGAITLIGVFSVHVWDVLRQKKASGLGWWRFAFHRDSMLFSLHDLREFWGSVKWFFGRGPRPHYGRYTYWEKFDYFAVFWGVFVIGSTGLLLWFPEFFTRLLPGQSVNVATIIHSDEALLAVAFIFTVHFFNTHFRPDKFPMDPVIFTGRVPLEEMRYDKPREYEEVAGRGELERYLAEPYPWAGAERVFRVFGFLALTVGLGLVFLILYTMVFGYR